MAGGPRRFCPCSLETPLQEQHISALEKPDPPEERHLQPKVLV